MEKELEAAVQAAHAAGGIIRSRFGQPHEVRKKGPIEIVTETDEEVERCIFELLRAVVPEYGFLGEESHLLNTYSGTRWVVDPLDGTSNFASNIPRFCVSIALEKSRELELGVIYDPIHDELFIAQRGSGARRDGHLINVSDTACFADAVVSTGFPYDAWKSEHDNLAEVGYFLKRVAAMQATGSAALDLADVACGRRDAHWERGLRPHDVAAGAVLVREAGGLVTDYAGDLDVQAGAEILAANRYLHGEMLSYLRTRHVPSH